MIQAQIPFPSIVENTNVKMTFGKIINYFDPFRGRNRKTKVLDVTNTHYWSQENSKLFDVTKTNNITGFAKDFKYNIIFFETPRNKNFDDVLKSHIGRFNAMLFKYGVLVVRITDFRCMGQLRGSYDVKECAEKSGFVLSDVIAYKNRIIYDETPQDGVKINHSYFMIFKRKSDLAKI